VLLGEAPVKHRERSGRVCARVVEYVGFVGFDTVLVEPQ